MWCYPLEQKTSEVVLRKIKEYFLCFGIPKIIQIDNRLEFCNIVSELYYENLSIQHIVQVRVIPNPMDKWNLSIKLYKGQLILHYKLMII